MDKRSNRNMEDLDEGLNIIEINNLYKEYKNKIAVKDISLTVKKGEIFGLLGPNGAGKTTTINILLGLLKPDRGICKIFQRDSIKIGEDIYEKMGVVFEEKNLYLRLTGYQNLRFFADLYGVNHDLIDHLLDKYDLSEAASRQVQTYSKGMRQRLLICRALLNDPELLILDEPTDGLDPVSLKIIHDSLQELKKQGKTILLCTHYMEEAERLCDRLAFIHNGEIIVINIPEKLKNKFGEELLEIKIHPVDEEIITFLKGILGKKDNMVFNKNSISIFLFLKYPDTGKKLDIINKKSDIISIHSREASLNDVFIKITS